MRVVYGLDSQVMLWVARNIPGIDTLDYGKAVALGVVSEEGQALAGVVFNEYRPQYGTIQVHVAAISPKWCTRNIVREILAYPFLQLKVNKVWSAMAHDNERAIRFNKGIGFKQEGTLRYHFGDKHAVVTGMLAKEFRQRYLNEGAGRREAA